MSFNQKSSNSENIITTALLLSEIIKTLRYLRFIISKKLKTASGVDWEDHKSKLKESRLDNE